MPINNKQCIKDCSWCASWKVPCGTARIVEQRFGCADVQGSSTVFFLMVDCLWFQDYIGFIGTAHTRTAQTFYTPLLNNNYYDDIITIATIFINKN